MGERPGLPPVLGPKEDSPRAHRDVPVAGHIGIRDDVKDLGPDRIDAHPPGVNWVHVPVPVLPGLPAVPRPVNARPVGGSEAGADVQGVRVLGMHDDDVRIAVHVVRHRFPGLPAVPALHQAAHLHRRVQRVRVPGVEGEGDEPGIMGRRGKAPVLGALGLPKSLHALPALALRRAEDVRRPCTRVHRIGGVRQDGDAREPVAGAGLELFFPLIAAIPALVDPPARRRGVKGSGLGRGRQRGDPLACQRDALATGIFGGPDPVGRPEQKGFHRTSPPAIPRPPPESPGPSEKSDRREEAAFGAPSFPQARRDSPFPRTDAST